MFRLRVLSHSAPPWPDRVWVGFQGGLRVCRKGWLPLLRPVAWSWSSVSPGCVDCGSLSSHQMLIQTSPQLAFPISESYGGRASVPSTDAILQPVSRPEGVQEEAFKPLSVNRLLWPTLQSRSMELSGLPTTPASVGALLHQSLPQILSPKAAQVFQSLRHWGDETVVSLQTLSRQTTMIPGCAHKPWQGPSPQTP